MIFQVAPFPTFTAWPVAPMQSQYQTLGWLHFSKNDTSLLLKCFCIFFYKTKAAMKEVFRSFTQCKYPLLQVEVLQSQLYFKYISITSKIYLEYPIYFIYNK